MFAISACPKCQRLVSIPEDIDAAWPVHCPHCGEQYPLGDAIPPELIPVSAEVSDPTANRAAPASPDTNENIVAVQEDELVEEFSLEDHTGLVEASVEETAIPTESPTANLRKSIVRPAAARRPEPQNEAVAAAGQILAGSSRMRRPKQKPWWHALRTLVMTAVFGLFGLLGGYYVVAWWFGPQFVAQGWPIFDFLPGIQRLTAPPEQPGGAKEKPAADKPAKTKPADVTATPKTPEIPKVQSEKPSNAPPEQTLPPVQQASAAAPPAASPAQEKLLRPQPGAADYIGPRMPPSINSEQLRTAIDVADTLLAADKPGAPMPVKTYEAFCRLSETVAFANGPASDTDLADRIVAAGKLLEKLAERPEMFQTLGPMADARLNVQHNQNVGILLAGTVKNIAKQDRLWGLAVELAGANKIVSVLSDQALEVNVEDPIVVLGVVVRDPGANLVGYTGKKPAVIWTAVLTKRPGS